MAKAYIDIQQTKKCKKCRYNLVCNGIISTLNRPPKIVCEDYENGI